MNEHISYYRLVDLNLLISEFNQFQVKVSCCQKIYFVISISHQNLNKFCMYFMVITILHHTIKMFSSRYTIFGYFYVNEYEANSMRVDNDLLAMGIRSCF